MNSDFSSPALAAPEPFDVLPLHAKWLLAGFDDWRNKQMIWQGSGEMGSRYQLVDSAGKSEICVLSFVSEDEKILFRAFQDWFQIAMRKISEASRGYFTFEVLQFEVSDAPWSWNNFKSLIVAHAAKLAVNERCLIQFGSLWGVLHKRTEGDIGKVEAQLEMIFCKPSPETLFRWIKKQSAKPEFAAIETLIFRDISRSAICSEEFRGELQSLFVELSSRNQKKYVYMHPGSSRCMRV